MPQQINLCDARYAPQDVRFSARQGVLAVALVLAGAWAISEGLHRNAQQMQSETTTLEQVAKPLSEQLRQQNAAPAKDAQAQAMQVEIEQLQAIEGSQRRVRAVLDAGVAGSRQGPSPYLVSLARQANGEVWLTGLRISEGGAVIDLQGRMLDPGALTAYLRRLNREPQFRGRPFAQLKLSTGTGDVPYTEFQLRASAANAQERP